MKTLKLGKGRHKWLRQGLAFAHAQTVLVLKQDLYRIIFDSGLETRL